MPIEAKHAPELKIIETVLSGHVSTDELLDEIEQVAALSEQHDCHLILSDYSQADSESRAGVALWLLSDNRLV
jgi:ABC-type transporter Mla MlaB component